MTLRELCCNKIALRLWDTRIALQSSNNIDMYFWHTEANLQQRCDLLEVCQELKPLIRAKIKHYGEKIFMWTKFVIKRLNLHPAYVMRIAWTANGGDIDVLRTVHEVIFPYVNVHDRFSVACELCQADLAAEIYHNQYTDHDRFLVRTGLKASLALKDDDVCTPMLETLFLAYWHDRITGNDSLHNQIQRHLDYFDLERRDNLLATLFTMAVVSGNVLGVRYTWSQMDPFTRWLVIRGLPEATSHVHLALELKFLGTHRVGIERVRQSGVNIIYEFEIVPDGEEGQVMSHLLEGQCMAETRRTFEEKALLFLQSLGIIRIREVPGGYYPDLQ